MFMFMSVWRSPSPCHVTFHRSASRQFACSCQLDLMFMSCSGALRVKGTIYHCNNHIEYTFCLKRHVSASCQSQAVVVSF